jgi:hypothetical protein
MTRPPFVRVVSEGLELRRQGTQLAKSPAPDALTQTAQMKKIRRIWWAYVLVLCAPTALACVQGQRATDTGDPGFPFGPSAIGVQTLAYNQDVKAILDQDCSSCHSAFRAQGNYSVDTYAATMAGQRPGDASSSLVVDGSPGGSMYRYWTGDATTKATIVFRWMVYYNALQNR